MPPCSAFVTLDVYILENILYAGDGCAKFHINVAIEFEPQISIVRNGPSVVNLVLLVSPL